MKTYNVYFKLASGATRVVEVDADSINEARELVIKELKDDITGAVLATEKKQ